MIHIREPRSPSSPLCQVAVANAALASSARLFNPMDSGDTLFSSTINPATQEPVAEIAGATVHAPSCMVAGCADEDRHDQRRACGRDSEDLSGRWRAARIPAGGEVLRHAGMARCPPRCSLIAACGGACYTAFASGLVRDRGRVASLPIN